MPIYEYSCSDCGKCFELFVGIKDKGPEMCVHCKSSHIRKLVSNCSFQLKGSGWYLTDYARKDSNNGNGSKKAQKEEPKAEATEKKTDNTDSKPEKVTPTETKASDKAA